MTLIYPGRKGRTRLVFSDKVDMCIGICLRIYQQQLTETHQTGATCVAGLSNSSVTVCAVNSWALTDGLLTAAPRTSCQCRPLTGVRLRHGSSPAAAVAVSPLLTCVHAAEQYTGLAASSACTQQTRSTYQVRWEASVEHSSKGPKSAKSLQLHLTHTYKISHIIKDTPPTKSCNIANHSEEIAEQSTAIQQHWSWRDDTTSTAGMLLEAASCLVCAMLYQVPHSQFTYRTLLAFTVAQQHKLRYVGTRTRSSSSAHL